jgi:hypothetical protein
VFCLLTALQFHELTTQLPRQIWIAMPRGVCSTTPACVRVPARSEAPLREEALYPLL